MSEKTFRYGGRDFTQQEINDIKHLVSQSSSSTRTALSRVVCSMLDWKKPDGGFKEVRCRVAMLRMHEDGLFVLPKPTVKPPCGSNKVVKHTERSAPQEKMCRPVHELTGLELMPVLDRKSASIWNEYVDRYHYLGHKTLPGAQIRYLIKTHEQLIGMLGFSASAWKTAPRDNFIGWSPKVREKNLYLVVNNARFLILPWIQSKNLASKLLAMASKRLPLDWMQRYRYQPVLLETFVEIPRFNGTCYKAANWIKVGTTQGRGKNDPNKLAALPKKDIYLYPLQPDFKQVLNQE